MNVVAVPPSLICDVLHIFGSNICCCIVLVVSSVLAVDVVDCNTCVVVVAALSYYGSKFVVAAGT